MGVEGGDVVVVVHPLGEGVEEAVWHSESHADVPEGVSLEVVHLVVRRVAKLLRHRPEGDSERAED